MLMCVVLLNILCFTACTSVLAQDVNTSCNPLHWTEQCLFSVPPFFTMFDMLGLPRAGNQLT